MIVVSIAVVGFKVQERKPVFNKKLDAVALGSSDDDRLLATIKSALEKSDFISIRCFEKIAGY